MTTVAERVREWFLLRDLQARRGGLSDELHVRTANASRVARRRREAAEALWLAGFPAEALRLAREAVELAREARREAGLDAGPDVDAGASDASDAAGTLAAQPMLDAQVRPEHAARFRALVDRQIRLGEANPELELEPQQITRLRVSRIAGVAASALAFVGLVVLVIRGPHLLRAKASASYDNHFEALNAVDANETTEWLLPDRAPGWIEVEVIPKRKLKRVKLMNARNKPYADRATKEFHVDLLDGGKVVKSFDGQFDAYSAEPTWRTLDAGVRADVVRIEIRSWFVSGGGLAEVQVE